MWCNGCVLVLIRVCDSLITVIDEDMICGDVYNTFHLVHEYFWLKIIHKSVHESRAVQYFVSSHCVLYRMLMMVNFIIYLLLSHYFNMSP